MLYSLDRGLGFINPCQTNWERDTLHIEFGYSLFKNIACKDNGNSLFFNNLLYSKEIMPFYFLCAFSNHCYTTSRCSV